MLDLKLTLSSQPKSLSVYLIIKYRGLEVHGVPYLTTASKGKVVSDLKSILGPDKVMDDEIIVRLYSREASGLESKAIAVLFPDSAEDVSRIVRYAYKHDIKIYAQCSSTSITGAAVPLEEGLVVSFERMNRIKEINVVDGVVVVEPAVRIDDLNVELASRGYMFPVDPASSASATVGGSIANGAGGMRGAKYGTMRDWVLGLQIVLPDENGTIMRVGCRTTKCRQGYDLARLMVGSEGTLALITEATLKITTLPENAVVALAFYPNLEDLIESVVDIKSSGIQPLIMEFMDDKTCKLAVEAFNIPLKAEGHMFLTALDVNKEAIPRFREKITSILKRHNASKILTADTLQEADKKGLFAIRRALYPEMLNYGAKMLMEKPGARPLPIVEDICVPPSKLLDAVARIKELEKKYGFLTFLGGHIGDGNLHPCIVIDANSDEEKRKMEEWVMDLMRVALDLGGTISSEHGIGTMKKRGLVMELERNNALKALEIMRAIKRIFDPKNILNPGKVIDLE